MSAGLALRQMNDLRQAMLPKVVKGFKDSQKLVRYSGQRTLLKGKVGIELPVDATLGWRLRNKAGSGPVPNAPFKSTPAIYDEYLISASVGMVQHVDKTFVYDSVQLRANKASPERILDILRSTRSAQKEAIANWLEAQLMTSKPQNASDTENYIGLPIWFRRSIDSSGNLVVDNVGGFNGTYVKWGDGTTTSILAGVDSALVGNERFRNYCATHTGQMGESLAEQIKRAQDECGWEPLDDLEGDFKATDSFKLIMDPEFNQEYQNICAKSAESRGTDLFPSRKYSVNGAAIVSCPQLRQDTARPIYGINTMEVVFKYVNGMWDNFAATDSKGKLTSEAMRWPDSHTSFYEPVDFYGQMVVEQPRHAGFVIHN